MIRIIGPLMATAILMWWASCTVAAPFGLGEGEGRYQHTRYVILASLAGPEDLESLAQELDLLREFDVSAVVVLLRGLDRWSPNERPADETIGRIRKHADAVAFEWRSAQSPMRWTAVMGNAMASIIPEAAYWQDRGYRLVPIDFDTPDSESSEKNIRTDDAKRPEPAMKDKGSVSGFRFSW